VSTHASNSSNEGAAVIRKSIVSRKPSLRPANNTLSARRSSALDGPLFPPAREAIFCAHLSYEEGKAYYADVKDRVRSELDFQVNRRAEAEIQSLSHQLSLLMGKMEDVVRQTASPEARTGLPNGAGEASS